MSAGEELIPILYTKDAMFAARWYSQLGFAVENIHRFEPHLPAFVTLVRGGLTLFLSEHRGDARPNTLIYLRLSNMAELAADFKIAPDENEWGPDFEVTDPDGNRLRIGEVR